MFAAFALSDEGQDFLRQKPDNAKDQDKLSRVLRDLKQLKDIAVESLRQCAEKAPLSDACTFGQDAVMASNPEEQ